MASASPPSCLRERQAREPACGVPSPPSVASAALGDRSCPAEELHGIVPSGGCAPGAVQETQARERAQGGGVGEARMGEGERRGLGRWGRSGGLGLAAPSKGSLVAVVKCGNGCSKRWCYAIMCVLRMYRILALGRGGRLRQASSCVRGKAPQRRSAMGPSRNTL